MRDYLAAAFDGYAFAHIAERIEADRRAWRERQGRELERAARRERRP